MLTIARRTVSMNIKVLRGLTDAAPLRTASLSAMLIAILCCGGCQTAPPATDSTKVDRIPFTVDLMQQWNFTDAELRGLQFFVHDTVTLYRELTEKSKNVVKGRLVLRSGQLSDEIVVPASTPGVAEGVQKEQVILCFERICQQDATIAFGCDTTNETCTKEWDGRYHTQAQRWEGEVGIVTYEGVEYKMNKGTYVEIDKAALANLEKRRRVLPGKRLKEYTQ
jgi:hypothetical protein